MLGITEEIMKIMNKAEKKYLDVVKEHGRLNKLADKYLNELRGASSAIISDMNACKRLGLIYKIQVDTVKAYLDRRISEAVEKSVVIHRDNFCDGSIKEYEIQYWMYRDDLTREQATDFVKSLKLVDVEQK